MKKKIVKIVLHFTEEDFELEKITEEYVKDVLESRGILNVSDYDVKVEEVND